MPWPVIHQGRLALLFILEISMGEVTGGTYTAEVADTDLHRHAGRALVAARQVVAKPGDDAWEGWVDAACGDEDAAVNNLRVAG
jgi:hypothetical protein